MTTFGSTHPLTPLTPLTPTDQLEPAEPATVREVAEEQEPAERKLPGRRVTVHLDGGEEFTVTIDNRDYLRWDKTAPRQKWGRGGDVPFLFLTFLAWSAAKRGRVTDLPWEQWETVVADLEDVTTEDDAVPPTR